MKIILVVFILLISGTAFSSDIYDTGEYDVFLSKWMLAHENYRLADVSDCNCLETIKKSSTSMGEKNNPYRVNGDFDGDEKNDLAVIVVDRNNAKDFLLLIFISSIANGKSPLIYGNIFGDTLAGLGLFKSAAIKNKTVLLFGAFGSEAEPIHIPVQVPNKEPEFEENRKK